MRNQKEKLVLNFELVLWFAFATSFLSHCRAKTIFVSPNAGMRTSILNMIAGDTIMLEAGSFFGPDNCGLELSTDNTTFQGVPGHTTIVCDGDHGLPM